jgi:hypothetical protein
VDNLQARARPLAYIVGVAKKYGDDNASQFAGPERDHLYERMKGVWCSHEMYERNPGRVIPVFRLTPSNPR